MRLIDADALRKCFEVPHELKCGIQAGMDEYALKCIDEQPTVAVSPWHRVEDELPSEFQYVWAACKMNGRENWTIETVYDPYLSCPWGYDVPELRSDKAVVYAWMDRSAPEPPKEDAR